MTTITEDYVSFEIAKLLKEKGFYSEDCFAFYKKNGEIGFLQTFGDIADYDSETCVIAPTHQMAMKWLREVHNIDICAFPYQADYILYSYNVKIYKDKEIYLTITDSKTYEESVEAALKYTLENLI